MLGTRTGGEKLVSPGGEVQSIGDFGESLVDFCKSLVDFSQSLVDFEKLSGRPGTFLCETGNFESPGCVFLPASRGGGESGGAMKKLQFFLDIWGAIML